MVQYTSKMVQSEAFLLSPEYVSNRKNRYDGMLDKLRRVEEQARYVRTFPRYFLTSKKAEETRNVETEARGATIYL